LEERGDRHRNPLARDAAIGIAAARIAIGLGVLLATRRAIRGLGFSPRGESAALARMAGARDIALGALTLAAAPDRDRLRLASLACAAVDAADAASFAAGAARGEGVERAAMLGIPSAVAATGAGLWIATRLR
jgi:Domain of unknown function (DUF4267)